MSGLARLAVFLVVWHLAGPLFAIAAVAACGCLCRLSDADEARQARLHASAVARRHAARS